MKVLSLLQPWASLVVIGAKRIETRSRNTNYRGPVLIHASKRKIPELLQLQCSWNFDAAFHSLGGTMSPGAKLDFSRDLPFGAIIGMVDINDSKKTELFSGLDLDIKRYAPGRQQDHWTERQLGDYSPGRYGWLLSNPISFTHHLFINGNRGFWNYDGRICHSCGCTDNDCRFCIEKTGSPCSWVSEDLCSTCV